MVDAPIGPAVDDLVRKALDLARSPNRLSPQIIHDIRVTLKRLRAAGRLLRPIIDDVTFRQADHAFRDAGRTLTGLRDAHVIAKTLKRVRKKMAKCHRRAVEPLRASLASPDDTTPSPPQPDWDHAIALIEQGVASLRSPLPEQDESANIAPGLDTAYRKARNWRRKALDSTQPQDAHQWRKWAKHLLYQLQFLSIATKRSALPRKRIKRMNKLGRILGRHHDLSLLRDAARAYPWEERHTLDELLAEISKRETRLLRKAGKLSKDTFSRNPGRFVGAIARRL